MYFSLVIPVYNEEKNLPFLFDKLHELLSKNSYEVVIVENGSLDNSREVLKKYLSKYKNLKCIFLKKNKGYGGGIIEGLKIAKGKFLSWTHADMQTNPCDVINAEEFIFSNKKNIFIKGLRKGRPLIDQFFTFSMSFIATLRLGYFFRDINAQPTIFPASFFQNWDNPPFDFSLDIYAYYEAKRLRYKIYRFPVRFSQRLFGTSSWNKDIISKIKFIKRNLKYIKDLSNKK